jgi:hypothetical protein
MLSPSRLRRPGEALCPGRRAHLAGCASRWSAHQLLTAAPVGAATAAPETPAAHVTSRRGPSAPPPSPALGASSAALHPSPWGARAAARAGVRRHGAGKSCHTPAPQPAAAVRLPRLCRGSSPDGRQPPQAAGSFRWCAQRRRCSSASPARSLPACQRPEGQTRRGGAPGPDAGAGTIGPPGHRAVPAAASSGPWGQGRWPGGAVVAPTAQRACAAPS